MISSLTCKDERARLHAAHIPRAAAPLNARSDSRGNISMTSGKGLVEGEATESGLAFFAPQQGR